MNTAKIYHWFALVLGIVFIVIGILGLIFDTNHGALLGIFSLNLVHNLIHVIFGILGIIAAYTHWPRLYARIVGVIYLIVGILGFIPALAPGGLLLGLVEINLADNILHVIIALVALYVGFALTSRSKAAIA
jgi:hypothetical protein